MTVLLAESKSKIDRVEDAQKKLNMNVCKSKVILYWWWNAIVTIDSGHSTVITGIHPKYLSYYY